MADEIEFLTPRDEAQQNAPAAPAKKRASELKPVDDDDLPF
jgi:hypothetical protein